MILCKNGHENEDGATYCRVCQTYIESSQPVEPATPTPPAAEPPTVTLDPAQLAVSPGRDATGVIHVGNPGTVSDEYVIAVDAGESLVASVEPSSLVLDAGAEGSASINFSLPATAAVSAGPRPFAIKVSSKSRPEVSALDQGVVEIIDLSAELNPKISEGEDAGEHTITVRNRGRAEIATALSARDAEAALTFDIQPARLIVSPGADGSAALHARARETPPWGRPKTHPFDVVAEPDGRPAIVLSGAMVQKPRFSAWLAAALLPLLLVLGVGVASLNDDGNGGGNGGPTPSPTVTSTPSPSPSPTPTPCPPKVEVGDIRPELVSTLQKLLAERGFDPGPADGVFGGQTAAAVKAFQQAQGLTVDGDVGPATWGELLTDCV